MKESRGSVLGPDLEMRGGHPDPKIRGGGAGHLSWICHWGWGSSEDQKTSHSPSGNLN